MSAPTILGDEDDLAPPAVHTVERGHRYRRQGTHKLHLASCPCWQTPAPAQSSSSAPLCPYCETQHEAGRTCRWRRWLDTFRGGRRG